MPHKCLTAAVVTAFLSLPYVARADVSLLPYIVNPSFEVPTTTCCSFPSGWVQGGTASGDAGNWDPHDFPLAGLSALGGNQVGYVNNYSGANPAGDIPGASKLGASPELNYWYLAQTLDIIGGMQNGTTYTLTYGVAVRADIATPSQYRVQINGNYSDTGCNTCDSITSGSTSSFVPGTWYWETVTYTAQAADQGLQPTIYLVNDGALSGAKVLTQVEFDLPEPAGGMLLGLEFGSVGILSLVFRRKLARG